MARLNEEVVIFPRVFVAKARVVLEDFVLLLPVGGQEQGHWGCLMQVTGDCVIDARLPPLGG